MDKLVKIYQLTKDKAILEKIIKELNDVVNYFLKNNKLKLSEDEVYDYIVEGIINAANNYMFYGVSFKSYANLCIARVFSRLNNKLFNENKLYEAFLDMLSMMEKKYKTTLRDNLGLIDITLEEMDTKGLLYPFSYEEAKNKIIKMLNKSSIEYNTKIQHNDIMKAEDQIDSDFLKRTIKYTLSSQEYDYITSYYGLFGKEEETHEKIGRRYNITGEAVRQAKENALKKIGYILTFYNSKEEKIFNIDKIIEFLEDFLSYQEIDYLCHTFAIFNYPKKSYQELTELYHEDYDTISDKVGMIIEKIAFLINHTTISSKQEFNNLYNLLETTLTLDEFKIIKHYYGLFNISKKSITEISELYGVDSTCINKILERVEPKLKDIFNNPMVNKFLSNILNQEEYEILCMINNSISKRYLNTKTIQNILNMIITKLNILYKYQDLNINREQVIRYLKSIYSEQEYKNICLKYGLFNNTRTKRPLEVCYRLSVNDSKLLQRIAITLNIENNKDKGI